MPYSVDGIVNTSSATPTKLTNTAKVNQLEEVTVRVPRDGDAYVSNFSQAPVDNLDNSIRAGARGPISIDDPVARERISHCEHHPLSLVADTDEGPIQSTTSAFPSALRTLLRCRSTRLFELHTSLKEFTCAKVLTEVGKQTPKFVRFSTVLGSRGAAETAREVRGFATRWYTEQGNRDLVGNNIPVFFIQDGIKFVDLIHAAKPEPSVEILFAVSEEERVVLSQFAEHVNHAQLFCNSLSKVEQRHIVEAAQFELGRVDDRGIQERMMVRFNEISHDLALEVSEGFKIPVGALKLANHGKMTGGQQPFSMLDPNNTFTAVGRKVGIFVLDGFDASQVTPLVAGLMGMGCVPQLIGSRKGPAYPSGTKIGHSMAKGVLPTDFTFDSARSTLFDPLFFPSGDEGYDKLLGQGRVIYYAREAFGHYKPIAACGVAVPWLMHKCLPGVLNAKSYPHAAFTSHKGLVLGPNIVERESSTWSKLTGIKDTATFGYAFVEACAAHKHWDRDVSGVAL